MFWFWSSIAISLQMPLAGAEHTMESQTWKGFRRLFRSSLYFRSEEIEFETEEITHSESHSLLVINPWLESGNCVWKFKICSSFGDQILPCQQWRTLGVCSKVVVEKRKILQKRKKQRNLKPNYTGFSMKRALGPDTHTGKFAVLLFVDLYHSHIKTTRGQETCLIFLCSPNT